MSRRNKVYCVVAVVASNCPTLDFDSFPVPPRNFLSAILSNSAPPNRKADHQRSTSEPGEPESKELHKYQRLPLVWHAMATIFVLPGEQIDPELLPSLPKQPLKLGPGLRHIPPNTVVPTVAGQLCTDKRKNAVWIEYNAGRVCISLLVVSALLIRT